MGQIPTPGVCPCALKTSLKQMKPLYMQTKAAKKMRTSCLRCFIFLVTNTININTSQLEEPYVENMKRGWLMEIFGEKIEFASFDSSCPFLARAFHFQIFYSSSSLRVLNSGWVSESPGELGKQLIFRLDSRSEKLDSRVRSETQRAGPRHVQFCRGFRGFQ